MDDDVTRRGFLAGTAAVAAGAAVLGPAASASTRYQASALPDPTDSGIDHIVVLMMENRSFDHYLGWLPGADGRQAGLTYPDTSGTLHATHHLTVPYGCGFGDPDHSYAGGRVEFDSGACDGFRRASDDYSIGYYLQKDVGFHGQAAPVWTVCDRYFSAILGPTFPNRLFQHAAQTDRISNTFSIADVPTIWDRLAAAGVPARYYYNDVPFTAISGVKYAGISHKIDDFYADAAAGRLPAVSFVDPAFLGDITFFTGLSQDEHPLADIRIGQHFIAQIYNAIVQSPNWSKALLVINYDEWGGFFDHVPPPKGPDPRPDLGTDGTGQRGFRVPCILIGPRARRGAVVSELYDHTSILKMIEWRWNLAPLTVRDAGANNIAQALDFTSPPDPSAPKIDVPLPITLGCLLPTAARGGHLAADAPADHVHHGDDWHDLYAYAKAHGFR